jgi:YVTN family beta-propeller protein
VKVRGGLLAAAATVVVIAMLLPSIGGVTQVRSAPAPTPVQLAVSDSAGVTIHVGSYPYGITFDPVNGLLYVTNFGSNNISVVNATTNQVVAWIPMPFGIGPIVTDTVTGVVYTGDAVSTVYGINSSTNRVEWRIPLAGAGCPSGCAPDAQTYDAANGDIYVTDIVTNNVSVIHGTTAVAAIPVGNSPNGAAYDSANGEVFVSNEGATIPANLTVIDGTTNRVVGQVYPSGNGPGVAYASSNGDVYTCTNGIQNGFSNLVSVANGTTNAVIVSIPISSACGEAVYDPNNGYVYITDRDKPGGQDLSNVTLVDPDTNRIVLTQPVELGPIGIAYDSANNNIYVANSDSGTISILPQIYRLTVHETGLPPGTNWSATVGETTLSSTAPAITFPETNGTFSFTIGRQTNRSACPSSGNVTVAGGPREQNVSFTTSECGGESSRGLFGFPGVTGYYIVGVLIALLVAATAVAIVLTRRKRREKPSPTTPPPDGAPGQNR